MIALTRNRISERNTVSMKNTRNTELQDSGTRCSASPEIEGHTELGYSAMENRKYYVVI